MQHTKLSPINMGIKNRFKYIRQDKLVYYPLLASIFCAVVGLILIPFMKPSLPEMVPLFYSLPRATERLATRDTLFLLPLSSLVITFVNFLCIFLFSATDKVISRMLSFSSLLTAILSLYTLLRIIFLII